MKLEQTARTYRRLTVTGTRESGLSIVRFVEKLLIVGILVWAALIQSSSAIPASEARLRVFAMATVGLGFDLIAWEVHSLRAKLHTMLTRPGVGLSEAEATQLVRDYMARAIHVGHLERELEQLESRSGLSGEESIRLGELQSELDALRLIQSSSRPVVEEVLERQVAWAIVQTGMGIGGQVLPPVKFAFTEPPRKVTVSPRDHIATTYTRMVRAGLSISILEEIESQIDQQPNAVGYVSNIGGLGAYPAMVVDRANLRWVIATIAHEWAHNYLTFFPLGLMYFGSGDLTTMNETVADIVGEEIGMMVLQRYYPDLLPPEPIAAEILTEREQESEAGGDLEVEGENGGEDQHTEEDDFDFREAMRETRLEVDRLLAEGRIEEAETYMEMRRLLFVEHGYGIRVLNQAYFAFHGSYATSPASVSPIGPKMETLRAATPDLPTFLQTVRWFTSQDQLDAALAQWLESDAR